VTNTVVHPRLRRRPGSSETALRKFFPPVARRAHTGHRRLRAEADRDLSGAVVEIRHVTDLAVAKRKSSPVHTCPISTDPHPGGSILMSTPGSIIVSGDGIDFDQNVPVERFSTPLRTNHTPPERHEETDRRFPQYIPPDHGSAWMDEHHPHRGGSDSGGRDVSPSRNSRLCEDIPATPPSCTSYL